MAPRLTVSSLGLLLAVILAGCTLYPDKRTPTVATTTSAEQSERILWEMASKQQWDKMQPILGANMVWNVPGKSLGRDQVIAYLQSLNLKQATVHDVTVKPNGPDMTVAGDLQFSTKNGQTQNAQFLSVWQETKGGGWILIAHSQTPSSAAASSGQP